MTLKVFFSLTFRVWDRLQQVKMVFQQTLRGHLGDRFDVFGVELQDIDIIAFLDENILAVRAPIIEVAAGIEA